MSTGYVFLFACVAFACHGKPIDGNGVHYETAAACQQAARTYANKRHIRHGHYEATCVERERP